MIADWDEIYTGVRNGDCAIGEAYSTDGRIPAWDLHTLGDPRVCLPGLNTAPVLRQAVVDANPDLAMPWMVFSRCSTTRPCAS